VTQSGGPELRKSGGPQLGNRAVEHARGNGDILGMSHFVAWRRSQEDVTSRGLILRDHPMNLSCEPSTTSSSSPRRVSNAYRPHRRAPDGIVVRVQASGLCRSDWHGWMGHDAGIRLPHVPGHELAGTVVEVGAQVRRWREGDRVTVPFVAGCGHCHSATAPCWRCFGAARLHRRSSSVGRSSSTRRQPR